MPSSGHTARAAGRRAHKSTNRSADLRVAKALRRSARTISIASLRIGYLQYRDVTCAPGSMHCQDALMERCLRACKATGQSNDVSSSCWNSAVSISRANLYPAMSWPNNMAHRNLLARSIRPPSGLRSDTTVTPKCHASFSAAAFAVKEYPPTNLPPPQNHFVLIRCETTPFQAERIVPQPAVEDRKIFFMLAMQLDTCRQFKSRGTD